MEIISKILIGIVALEHLYILIYGNVCLGNAG